MTKPLLSLVYVLAATPFAAAPALAQPWFAAAEGAKPAPIAGKDGADASINPTGRDISLNSPLRIDGYVVGEVSFTIHADQTIAANSAELLEAIATVAEPSVLDKLRTSFAGKPTVTPEDLAANGIQLHYNRELIALDVTMPPHLRKAGVVPMNGRRPPIYGNYDRPAGLSGYLNMRTSLDYVWSGLDKGVQSPYFQFDGAIRAGGFVLESEANLNLGTRGEATRFQREGTRLVYDDIDHVMRWTAGDLLPQSRGFSGTSQMAGISVLRSYSTLDPTRIVQPTGSRTVTITRPSVLHAYVNGQSIQDVRLQPGVYNVRDFPFAQGTNDVRLVVEDNAGLQETISFSLFFDQSLLDVGLDEFGLYAGIAAPNTQTGRDYQFDTPTVSGFYRRGLTDRLTAGVNFNARERGAVVGAEITFASPLGTLGANAAFSTVSGIGSGYALNVGLQHNFGLSGGRNSTLTFSAETRSRNFANPTDIIAENRFDYEVEAEYTQPIGNVHSVSVSGRYSHGRDAFESEKSARVRYSYFMSQRLNLHAEALYEDRPRNGINNEYTFRLNLTYRLGRNSRALAQFDSRNTRAAAGFEISGGQGVGAWSASALVGHSDSGTDLSASARYTANRADLGITHATTLSSLDGTDNTQRTSARLGTALVFADGHFALSRPVYDSFALAVPHRTLKGARVEMEPRDGHYVGASGWLGGAVNPNIGSYFQRVISYDVPTAPTGYDLGAGNIRVRPPYRSGYLIVAGSDYSVLATGTLFNEKHEPISLIAGKATELAHPDRPPVEVFTNRAGKFGLQGLRPGQWRIDMPTVPPKSVSIDVPQGSEGVVSLGDLTMGPATPQGEKP